MSEASQDTKQKSSKSWIFLVAAFIVLAAIGILTS